MTRFSKTTDGKYRVNGMTHDMLIGSRAQVWHGTAHKTSGGLTKKDLMQNKAGRIVSRAKHSSSKKEMRLVKAGYGTKKGKFGFVKLGHGTKKSKKMRGGTTKPYMSNHAMPITIGKEAPPLGIPGAKLGGSKKRRGGTTKPYMPNHPMPITIGKEAPPLGIPGAKLGGSKKMRGGYSAGPYSPAAYYTKGGSRKHKRGGYFGGPMSPSPFDGRGVGTSGVAVQLMAGEGN